MPETPHNLEAHHQVSGPDSGEVPAAENPKADQAHWSQEAKASVAPTIERLAELKSSLQAAEQTGDLTRAEALLKEIEMASSNIETIAREQEGRYQEHLKNPGFQNDKTKDGWTLKEDTFPLEVASEDLDIPNDLIPAEFFKEGEESIAGTEMLRRAKEMEGTLADQAYAEYLLDHQDEILKSWDKTKTYIFPGTTWRDSGGRLCVPCLRWGGGGWCLGFGWLGGRWGGRVRVVRLNPETLKSKTA